MSLKSLPFIFLNMGGEMCYILDQRLQAQNVKKDKAIRVMNDIVSTMFNVKFLDELFKPQEQYSKKAMRALFDKLAHASIMRLNATSMDKLYDLMTMAVKYQFQSCASPKDILVVTMNHMDGVRKLVQGSPNVQTQIDHAYKWLSSTYFSMNLIELQLVRQTVLNFFQDTRVKVSILLREKQQKDDGRFIVHLKTKIPYGGQAPGTVRSYVNGKANKTVHFNSGGVYTETTKDGVLDKTAKQGERGTDLGTNMYKNQAADTQGGFGSSYSGGGTSSSKDALVKEELQLLSHLIRPATESEKTNFSLSLFDDDEDEENFVVAAKEGNKNGGQVIKIDASKRDKKSVDKIMSDLSVKDTKPKKSKGEDMLDLMDS